LSAYDNKAADLVILDRRNIQMRRPKDKLDYKRYGLFAMEKVILPTAI
jgi:hypothetical protein